MKTKRQKRQEALERVKEYKFENSKIYRLKGDTPETRKQWEEKRNFILESLK